MNSGKLLLNIEAFLLWLKEGILPISGVMNAQTSLRVHLLVDHSPSLHEDMQTFWLGGDEGLCI